MRPGRLAPQPAFGLGDLHALSRAHPDQVRFDYLDKSGRASGRGMLGLAELIVSELVTNALRHGDGPIEMRLSFASGDLRVEVHDGGAGRPVRQHVTADDECGRGLELLDGLIELYGGERGVLGDGAGPGKTIYVEFSLPACSAGAW